MEEQDAFLTACAECGIEKWNPNAQLAQEFYEMLPEWYFSGNWLWEEAEHNERESTKENTQ